MIERNDDTAPTSEQPESTTAEENPTTSEGTAPEQGTPPAAAGADQTAAPEGTKPASNLFDLMGEEGEQFKKKPEKPQAESAKGTGTRAQAKPQTVTKYRAGMELHYSGQKLTLPNEMSEAEVFTFLSDDFPELTTDRAEVREDKHKGRLVIALKSFKKGADTKEPSGDAGANSHAGGARTVEVMTEPPPVLPGGSLPPLVRLLADGGVYEARTTGAGTFVAKMDARTEVREGFYPAVPKAPASLLARIVAIFKEMADREAVVCVVYDKHEGLHHLIWNDQRDAGSGSVTYNPVPETGRIVPYVEVHSHNTMSAYFSETDDEFEKRTGLYGMIGRVEEDRPEALFRFSCGGTFRPVFSGGVFHNTSGLPVVVSIVRDLYFEEPYR